MRDRAPLPADPLLCPPLAPTTVARFDAGCAALHLGDLPAGARDAILGHLRLLLAWTEAVNLTAIRNPDAAVTGHLLDSLAAVPLLREARVTRFLDLGSGGGYPGLPLALALPAGALLVDSVAKKAAFLRVAVAAAGVADRVTVAAVRAEALAVDRRQRERWPAVTVRAVAQLPELVELAFPLLVPGGLLLAWKRAGVDDERARAGAAVTALGGGSVALVPLPAALPGLENHVLVAVRKEGRTGGDWPRPPAERKRRPW
ncbi:MAG TPA: 16S rRNA (guanine(527)-N(7))-methyltransferase RsmG [Candidatus Nanopelagicales bacterium]|nr:16S rRNA (guanine(527)-N(7))-methyltransferase RsmG [Candidatus Nanopelagicales bacterium]